MCVCLHQLLFVCMCVCFLRCISILPPSCTEPTGRMLSFLSYYSSQTTCTCLPERNFSFLLLSTLFKRIYKRICLTSLVPEMHFLVEILKSQTTAFAIESLRNDDGNVHMKLKMFLLFHHKIIQHHLASGALICACVFELVWRFLSSVEIWGLDGAQTSACRVSRCAAGPCW